MATFAIHCTDPNHAANAAQPGWNDGPLGTSDRPVTDGHRCSGCAAAIAAILNSDPHHFDPAHVKTLRGLVAQARAGTLTAAQVGQAIDALITAVVGQ